MEAGSGVVRQVLEQRDRVRAGLSRIKHKVAIMSGKGGVGKSAVTANLALALAQRGFSVGVLDADIDGPSIPRILGAGGQRLGIEVGKVTPATAMLNIKVISMGLLLSSEDTAVAWQGPDGSAFAWRGAMEMSTIREFLSDVNWGALDLLLIDLPPGTQQLHNLVELAPEMAGVVMVTIPSQVAEATVRRSMDFARQLGVPVIGLVKNMDGLLCPRCAESVELFPGSDAPGLASDWPAPFTARVPFDPSLARCSDKGEPYLLLFGDSPVTRAFHSMAEETAGFLELLPSPDRQEARG